MPTDWALTPARARGNSFGGGFADTLSERPVATWFGPVRSGLGMHLVLVTENQPEHLAPFGYVSLPPLPVETLIALSILLVAVEAIHRKDGIYIESALDPQYSL